MMLVERAAEKPSILKLISVAVQRASPAITGNRERFTHSPAGGTINSTHHEESHHNYYLVTHDLMSLWLLYWNSHISKIKANKGLQC